MQPTGVRRLAGSARGASVAYRLAPADGPAASGRAGAVDGPAWAVRAFRADAPVGVQFSGCATPVMVDWLASRAATLAWLEQAGYPAPRVVRTRTGELIGQVGVWLTWATTFIEGPVVRPTVEQLGMLGDALGRLHSLPGGLVREFSPGRSCWHPDAAIPATLARLDTVEALVPDEWRPMHAEFRRTVEVVRQHAAALPQAVVHGDAWPANAIQAGPDSVTLIDWETSGLGLAVLDLGNCLLECHLDAEPSSDQPQAWHVQPDEQRIAAVAAGYSARRALSAAELGVLPQAVGFGAAFIGAIHFEQALAGGVRGRSMDVRLDRLRNRLSASAAVAEVAARHLAVSQNRYAEPGRPRAAGA